MLLPLLNKRSRTQTLNARTESSGPIHDAVRSLTGEEKLELCRMRGEVGARVGASGVAAPRPSPSAEPSSPPPPNRAAAAPPTSEFDLNDIVHSNNTIASCTRHAVTMTTHVSLRCSQNSTPQQESSLFRSCTHFETGVAQILCCVMVTTLVLGTSDEFFVSAAYPENTRQHCNPLHFQNGFL